LWWVSAVWALAYAETMKKSDVPKRLGLRVSSFRLARGYTQEQLAVRCGVTSKFVSEIERGLVNVPIVTLANIGTALGVTISELTLGVDGGMPNVTREGGAIYAGRSHGEQVMIAKLLVVIDELVKTAKIGG
jgi:transcriptional regulator with XRE-family HTH domain